MTDQLDDCHCFIDQCREEFREACDHLDPVTTAQVQSLFIMAINASHDPAETWRLISQIRAVIEAKTWVHLQPLAQRAVEAMQ